MGILIKAPSRRAEPRLTSVDSPAPVADLRGALHIREVVRTTGLRREQLYMWQRRYGFPAFWHGYWRAWHGFRSIPRAD